jgi:Type II secretory pathway, component PulF
MVFRATIKTPDGRRLSQKIDAADRAAALRQLHADGAAVLSLEPDRSVGGGWRMPDWRIFGKPRALNIEFGLRQLSSMIKSGLSLLVALRTAAEQSGSRGCARVWNRIAEQIESGLSMHDAMRGYACFDAYTLALVKVGEQTGELEMTLRRAAEHLEQTREMRMMLVNALIYPTLVVVMTIGVVALMVVKVIPQIETFLSQANQTLPAITRWLLDFSNYMRVNIVRICVVLAAIPLSLFLIRRFPYGREQTDRAALYLPVIGKILRLSRTAVMARGLSILLESGVSLLDGLDTVILLVRNSRLVKRLQDAKTAVIGGESLAGALSSAPEFMPMLAKMTAVGESTGTLGSTLAEIADFHEMLLKNAIKRFGIIIEPVLIVLVGGIVGFVYTAFFMALFSIATAS